MTTPYSAMAAVAAGVSGVNPNSESEVERFYEEIVPSYDEGRRSLLLDWLTATVKTPSAQEVEDLVRALRSERNPARDSRAAPAAEIPADRRRQRDRLPTQSNPVLQGVVVRLDKTNRTVVVKLDNRVAHHVANKRISRMQKLHVPHNVNDVQIGQIVFIEKKYPYSKLDAWRIVEDHDNVCDANSTYD